MLAALPHIDGPSVRAQARFIRSRLEVCLNKNLVSNDAFLDSGVIEGALDMIANHTEMGVSQDEIRSLISQQIYRAEKLESKYPGLDRIIEQGRN